jgi:hypothetical protein
MTTPSTTAPVTVTELLQKVNQIFNESAAPATATTSAPIYISNNDSMVVQDKGVLLSEIRDLEYNQNPSIETLNGVIDTVEILQRRYNYVPTSSKIVKLQDLLNDIERSTYTSANVDELVRDYERITQSGGGRIKQIMSKIIRDILLLRMKKILDYINRILKTSSVGVGDIDIKAGEVLDSIFEFVSIHPEIYGNIIYYMNAVIANQIYMKPEIIAGIKSLVSAGVSSNTAVMIGLYVSAIASMMTPNPLDSYTFQYDPNTLIM